ncbi:MAG TPA: ferritin-like domain-containing protein [Polyangiaceae bacterium]|nr:ferritin-like domain-containing protein [Polyangiaceae bacterium]
MSRAARTPPTSRPTAWWLAALERRATRMHEYGAPEQPLEGASDVERRAAIKFFNAAFRAEESGIHQAHELAGSVQSWDPELAEVLRLYGNEEGWHRELLTEFLAALGGQVEPMGRVTRTLYKVYARAKRMDTIVLSNLMFETIGSTTYRLALGNVRDPAARRMLTILTRDEAFHVPLNVHFLRRVLEREPGGLPRLRRLYWLLFGSLVLLPLASRPKAQAFDHIETRELMRAYALELGRLFAREHDLDLAPPRLLLRLLGISPRELTRGAALSPTSVEAAELAVDREQVVVTAGTS